MTIGDRVKQKRIEKNISQSLLADLVGMKQQSISDIESGNIEKPRNIVEIAKALNCSVEWLYYGKNFEREKNEHVKN
ncbi:MULTISPECIES: helix-turn-helix domain-containing protein [unclassified Gilliamella]|uniref:helix-turn-helix domain-containing protein n=1 Tax=unclassified Gilliamella TaxID=2685620 RepID=UPI00226AAB4E|nr:MULTISPECIES: helix-turn-helix transcriptional regulator [unclassified Gilliamella]MCX8597598.1 helix-turn-helix transcriptional regulator [Gilliamella sp. B3493]MCX8599083.1 helix-turn-helix transcriptional regulator [Gilliamella sp. B3486]MCX8688907.1 helix-turn-helix transcriptional regulator [Gilliamella sp. B2973]MCX8704611.1 helix-turn-helix transcriptional regulator [Gilliamella sp. B3127]